MILEDIGERDDALLCITNLTACCGPPYTGGNGVVFGNWLFPNGTRVPSDIVNKTSEEEWDFYRDRDQMVVRMNRRRGGVEGVYRCEIPDTLGLIQTLYIGVYSISTGEWLILYLTACKHNYVVAMHKFSGVLQSNANLLNFLITRYYTGVSAWALWLYSTSPDLELLNN